MGFIPKGQQCLLVSNGTRPLPPFERTSDDEFRLAVNPIQAIITSYRFDCCGVITGWGTFTSLNNSYYSISFQVWRPSSPSIGCYYLIGVNNSTQNTDPAIKGLISVSVQLSKRIRVQPGDVVGFNFTSDKKQKDGILFSIDESYGEESVWFETAGDKVKLNVEIGQTTCPDGSFTNLAPLITVTVGE